MDNRGGHRGQFRRRQYNNNNNQGRRDQRTPRPGEERPKKEAILDLVKYQDKQIRVKFSGGREGELLHAAKLSNY